MKKKFLVGSLLPVLAGAAVVGSGFSLWFFNDTENHANQDASANVTQLVEVGSVEAASNFGALNFRGVEVVENDKNHGV